MGDLNEYNDLSEYTDKKNSEKTSFASVGRVLCIIASIYSLRTYINVVSRFHILWNLFS